MSRNEVYTTLYMNIDLFFASEYFKILIKMMIKIKDINQIFKSTSATTDPNTSLIKPKETKALPIRHYLNILCIKNVDEK